MLKKTKKINPKKKPATQADVNKAFEAGKDQGIKLAIIIFLTVLLDKFNGAEYITDVWAACNKLCEEIEEGRVNCRELVDVMREEYDIELSIK